MALAFFNANALSIGFYLYRTRIGLGSHLSFRALSSGMLNVLNAIIFDI